MPSYPVQTPDGRWAIFSTVVDNFTHAQLSEDECRNVMTVDKGYTAEDVARCMAIARYEQPATTPFLEYCYYGECINTIRAMHGSRETRKVRAICEGEEPTTRKRRTDTKGDTP